MRKKAKMSSDEILEELAKLARSNVRNMFKAETYIDDTGAEKRRVLMMDPLEMGEDAAAAIAGIEVVGIANSVLSTTKVKHWDKHAALRTLAQIHKLIGAEVEINLGNELAQRMAAARKRARKE